MYSVGLRVGVGSDAEAEAEAEAKGGTRELCVVGGLCRGGACFL